MDQTKQKILHGFQTVDLVVLMVQILLDIRVKMAMIYWVQQ